MLDFIGHEAEVFFEVREQTDKVNNLLVSATIQWDSTDEQASSIPTEIINTYTNLCSEGDEVNGYIDWQIPNSDITVSYIQRTYNGINIESLQFYHQ